VQGSPEFILRNPESVPTIYDPALVDSNPRSGSEAALSAFDAQLSTSLTWEKIDTPQNVSVLYTSIFPNVKQDDLGTFQARLQKTAATGATFAMSHSVAYDLSNSPSRIYSSDWNVKLVAEMRQPLLQGAGTQFNRIAGPGATPGAFNGVMLARINADIALANFEAGVRNLVSSVEVAYWELYFNYQQLGTAKAGRDDSLRMWRWTWNKMKHGARGGSAAAEASTRNQYFIYKSSAEQALNDLYATEANLRYLLGLAATDGRLICPKDEATTAKVTFDWADVLGEGLVRSPELRQEKWIVKQKELSLIAAKNFLLPKLDLVAQYRWLGMGNRLDGANSLDLDSFSTEDSNAYRTLMNGQYQEWQIGFQGQINLGFRREMAGVRNAQLDLTKEQSKLQEGELELSHQLAYALRDLETNYVLAQTSFSRRKAAEDQMKADLALYEGGMAETEEGTPILNDLLRAQQEFSQAERDYYRTVVNYNKAIAQVHYRKGSLLEYNGVYLAEGPWPGKAYFDARRRSRARAASTYLDYGFTQPKVVSRGPIEQNVGGQLLRGGEAIENGEAKQQEQDAPAVAPPKPEPVPPPSDTLPIEPPTPERTLDPKPLSEPSVKPSKSTSDERDRSGGWQAPASQSRVTRAVDRLVLPAGWNAVDNTRRNVDKSSSHESGENPSSAATDRSASGWKGVQR
jgi:outer membrane protein TolC